MSSQRLLPATGPAKLFLKSAGRTEEEGHDDIPYFEFLRVLMLDASGNPSTLWDQAYACLNKLALKDEVTRRWHNIITQCTQHNEAGRVTDVLAQLIFLAPNVAAVLLDMTLIDETDTVELKFVDFTGVFLNDPMRCKYALAENPRPPSRGCFAWAYAKFNRVFGWDGVPVGNAPNNLVPDEGVRGIDQPSDQNPNVLQITKYRCMLPNILDLDIIQALCITHSRGIFAKKSVQALLYCTWRVLSVNVVYVKVGLSAIEVLTLLAWGMTTADGSLFDRLFWRTKHDSKDPEWLLNHTGYNNSYKIGSVWAFNSSANAQCKWNILAAMSLRQVLNFCWNLHAFLQRRRMAEHRHRSGKTLFGYLRMVWGYGIYFGTLWNLDLLQLLVRCLFLFLTFGTSNPVMSSTQQAMLSATFFMSVGSILNHFRYVLCKISLSRMAMRKALEDSEVTHFLCLFAGLFTMFIVSWEIIDRESTFFDAMTLGYRGLVVGDGDGLDFLGQNTDEDIEDKEEAHKFKLFAGTVATVVFFSYLMNLVIAIFGSTYDDAKKFVWLHFHQVRARFLRDTILSCHKFAFFKRCWTPSPEELLAVSISLCLGGACLQLLVGFGSVMFLHLSASIFSILMMAAGSVLLEAYPFVKVMDGRPEDDWFPWNDDLPTHHHLHVWCRADYDEDLFLGTDDMEQKYRELSSVMTEINLRTIGVEEDLTEQNGHCNQRMDKFDRRVDALGQRIEERIDALGQQMQQVVGMLQRAGNRERVT